MNAAEARMREFPCRTCDAATWQPCISKSGRVLSYAHADRWYQARVAGRLPVDES